MENSINHTEFTNFIFDLIEDVEAEAVTVLGLDVIKELTKYEENDDSDRYMGLLIENKHRLTKRVGNFLYHRWIKILTLRLYSDIQRKTLAKIPIAYLLGYPQLEAFITSTKRGPVICFSSAFNDVMSWVFKTLVKSPQMSIEDAADHLISIGEFLVNFCPEERIPSEIQLDRNQLFRSDLANNQMQIFTLAHEYAHLLLGHLTTVGDLPSPVREAKYSAPLPDRVYQIELKQELDADAHALKHLIHQLNSWADKSWFFSSIKALFLFVCLSKLLLGFSDRSSEDIIQRINTIRNLIFGGTNDAHQFSELQVFNHALVKVNQRY